MPVISIEYEDLISLLGKPIPQEELIEKIPMMGAHIEGVKGNTIDIEFFPNRPDLYSVEGIARALKGFLDIEVGLPKYEVEKSEVNLVVDKSVEEVRPFVVGGLIKGIEMSDFLVRSLMDLQEKLHLTIGRKRKKVSIGVHDFDKVVPPFIYKAIPPKSLSFVPLGWKEEMNLLEILQGHEKGIEYGYVLEGKERYPVILDSKNQVLSFPPIINGVITAVTDYTRNLFIDVTGTDLESIKTALSIVCTALADRGGKIFSIVVRYEREDMETPDLKPKRKTLSGDYSNSLLGLSITQQEMARGLERMRFGCSVEGNLIKVDVPQYRNDVLHPVDLVEDIAIAYGYPNIPLALPKSMTMGGTIPSLDFCENLREMMIGYGFHEVTTLSLSKEDKTLEENYTRIKNPISEEHIRLRSSLLPSLLEILRVNRHRDLPQRIFEIGDAIVEARNRRKLCALIIHSKASFTEIKSLVQSIMRDIGINFEIQPKVDDNFLKGRCASILVKEKECGYFGEIHPRIITGYELSYPVVGFELDISSLLSINKKIQ